MQVAAKTGQSVAPALDGIEVSISPEFSTVELFPAAGPDGIERFRPLWHEARNRKGPAVTVSSIDGAAHKVTLQVEGSTAEWRPNWTNWTLRKRKARELEGGSMLDEQDVVSADGQTLTAMIMAGETRTFTLELIAGLDEATKPGMYGFDVVVRSANPKASANGAMAEQRHSAFLTLVHPRSKLLNQLPAIYLEEVERLKEDEGGASPFFERFLLGFEDARRPLQKTLDHLNDLFGPYSTPSEFVLWLGAWVCVPMDENWSEMRRRHLINEAIELYRWQGTKRGLSRYLEIYTGVRPEINDVPVKGMRLGPNTKLGAPDTILGDVPPHTFVVTIAIPDTTAVNEQVVHDIIAFEKPAHTAYSLRILRRTG